MDNSAIVLMIVVLFIAVVCLTLRMIEFGCLFAEKTRRIVRKRESSVSVGELRYWTRKLRCHYLCLLPFVNACNVMPLYRRLFESDGKQGREAETKRADDGIYHVLAPSFLGLGLCIFCLCGTSWAWFSATETGRVEGIVSADYQIEVSVSMETDTDYISIATRMETDGYSIPIEGGQTYLLAITASGSATGGYCRIWLESEDNQAGVPENVYYISQIKTKGENRFLFRLCANTSGNLRIRAQWGSCSVTEEEQLIHGIYRIEDAPIEPETSLPIQNILH